MRLLGEIAAGTDIAAIRDEEKTAPTVEEFCWRYLNDAEKGLVRYRGRPKKPSTIATDRGRIERHIIPLLGSKLIKNVSSGEVEQFMHDVAEGATQTDFKPTKKFARVRVQGGIGTASRTVGLLGSIFTYAMKKRLVGENPVRGVERYKDNKRTRVLSDEEWRSLGRALDDYRADGGNSHAINIIILIAYTGARRGEIVGLKYRETDLEKRVFDLEDTKSGRSMRPMSNLAREVLEGVCRSDSSIEYWFPAENRSGHYTAVGRAWRAIASLAELPPEITPHTLRHSYATIAAEEGYATSTISALLGHKASGTTERYVHRRIDSALLAAADRVAWTINAKMFDRQDETVVFMCSSLKGSTK